MRALFALLIGVAPAMGAAPFSHKLHLRLKLECTGCHSKISTSTRVEDNNLPNPAACQGCHKEVTIKSPAPTRLARFPHERHLKLGNIAPVLAAAIDSRQYLSDPGHIRSQLNTTNACLACHRGIDQSDAVGKAYFPQMADCLVCHNKIAPPDSCAFCHGGDANLKPATHTNDWLDKHTNKAWEKGSCAVCHGRRFTCLGCH